MHFNIQEVKIHSDSVLCDPFSNDSVSGKLVTQTRERKSLKKEIPDPQLLIDRL